MPSQPSPAKPQPAGYLPGAAVVCGAGAGIVIGVLGGGLSAGMHIGVFTGLAIEVASVARRR